MKRRTIQTRAARTTATAIAATLALGGGVLLPVSAAFGDDAVPATPAAEVPATPSHRVVPDGDPQRTEYNSQTSIQVLNNPTSYGDIAMFAVTVTVDAPVLIGGSHWELLIDGVVAQDSQLFFAGPGKFLGLVTLPGGRVPAGTHAITARFLGATDGLTGTSYVRPSVSGPKPITLAQAKTTTTLTTWPRHSDAFTPVTVEAKVASSVPGISGAAELLANSTPVASAEVAQDGTVVFASVSLPTTTTDLVVRYLGDSAKNYEPSVSDDVPSSVDALETSTTLVGPTGTQRADEPLEYRIRVDQNNPDAPVSPRGVVEFLVDGDVVQASKVDDGSDPDGADRTAEVTAIASGLTVGDHQLSARFVAASGFSESESDGLPLHLNAVETTLVPSDTALRGTPEHPASVSVTATKPGFDQAPQPGGVATRTAAPAADADPARIGVDGTVQAFVGDTPLGDPVNAPAGEATVALTGLQVGTHEVTLRFASAEPGVTGSSADVTVTVAADAESGGTDPETPDSGERPTPHPQPGAKPHDAALATTGAPADGPLQGLAAAAALLGGAAIVVSTRRRRAAER